MKVQRRRGMAVNEGRASGRRFATYLMASARTKIGLNIPYTQRPLAESERTNAPTMRPRRTPKEGFPASANATMRAGISPRSRGNHGMITSWVSAGGLPPKSASSFWNLGPVERANRQQNMTPSEAITTLNQSIPVSSPSIFVFRGADTSTPESGAAHLAVRLGDQARPWGVMHERQQRDDLGAWRATWQAGQSQRRSSMWGGAGAWQASTRQRWAEPPHREARSEG